jgi:Tol biopolymer transport system component
MKKNVLVFFILISSCLISIIQISCNKEARAQGQLNLVQINKLVYYTYDGQYEIWTCNYDGSGQSKVNIVLPSGVRFYNDWSPRMSPDGRKIFFSAINGINYSGIDLYVCNSDGTSLVKIVDSPTRSIYLGGAY